jgi:hypothetical protein
MPSGSDPVDIARLSTNAGAPTLPPTVRSSKSADLPNRGGAFHVPSRAADFDEYASQSGHFLVLSRRVVLKCSEPVQRVRRRHERAQPTVLG